MAIQGIGSTTSLLNTIDRKTEAATGFQNLMAKATDNLNAMSSDKAQASTMSNGATPSRTAVQEDILRYAQTSSQDAEEARS
jgi:lipopolysaccharide export LptBFGC system permease protein LptF